MRFCIIEGGTLYVVSYKKKSPDSEKKLIYFPDSLSKIGVTHGLLCLTAGYAVSKGTICGP